MKGRSREDETIERLLRGREIGAPSPRPSVALAFDFVVRLSRSISPPPPSP